MNTRITIISRGRQWSVVALLAVVASACGDDTNLGQICDSSKDCSDGLTCRGTWPYEGQCTKGCKSRSDCEDLASGAICDTTNVNGSFCALECAKSADCPDDTTCRTVESWSRTNLIARYHVCDR